LADSWTYDEVAPNTSSTPTPGFSVITVTGTASIKGQQATVFSTVDDVAGSSSDDYYAVSGGGVTYFGNNSSSDLVTPQITPYVELTFPAATGTSSTIVAKNISLGTATNGDKIQTSFTQTTGIQDFETVIVTAGVFSNAAKVVQSVTGTETDAATGASVQYSGTQTSWLAPGVGTVQQITTSNITGTTTTSTDTARGYTVGGVAHGVSKTYTVDVNSDGGTDPLVPELAVAASASTSMTISFDSQVPQLNAEFEDLSGTFVATTSLGEYQYGAAAFDGTNFEAAIEAYLGNSIRVQLLSPSGALGASYSLANSTSPNVPIPGPLTMSMGQTNLLVGFLGTDNSTNCICVAFGLPNGQGSPIGEVVVSTYPLGAPQPTIASAFDGTNFLVVWTAPINGGYSTYAARVSQAGVVLDTTPILIWTGIANASEPAVAFDGTNYLVVCNDARNPAGVGNVDIYGARVSTAGVLLDGPPATAGVLLSSAAVKMPRGQPSVAFNGTEYLVAWKAGGGPGYNGISYPYDAVGVRVTPALALPGGADFELGFGSPTANTNTTLATNYQDAVVARTVGGTALVVMWKAAPPTQTNLALQGVTVNPF
jgi:hypothetical protein